MEVEQGKTYLLRIVNGAMDESLFFAVAKHKLILVGTDGFYTKPFEANYIIISPGQTMDVLMQANQPPSSYYLASSPYSSAFGAGFDNSTATGIIHYHQTPQPDKITPSFPHLPPYNSTFASTEFTRRLRSLSSKDLPTEVDTHLFITVSVNLLNCTSPPCTGPLGKRFSASLNNVSFVPPSTDILQAYYRKIHGVFRTDFPRNPPKEFDYTGKDLPGDVLTPEMGTRALVVEYNASVEMLLQGTNVVAGDNHPMHLHGYGFYVVGWGFGNFDKEKDPLRYNLDDPPQETTVGIPNGGWVAIRFRADNPG